VVVLGTSDDSNAANNVAVQLDTINADDIPADAVQVTDELGVVGAGSYTFVDVLDNIPKCRRKFAGLLAARSTRR